MQTSRYKLIINFAIFSIYTVDLLFHIFVPVNIILDGVDIVILPVTQKPVAHPKV